MKIERAITRREERVRRYVEQIEAGKEKLEELIMLEERDRRYREQLELERIEEE